MVEAAGPTPTPGGAAACGEDEFAEIPAHLREEIDAELRREALDRLHAEAVERGELPPPPRAWFERLPGRALALLFQLCLGGAIGTLSVAIVLYAMRFFATVL